MATRRRDAAVWASAVAALDPVAAHDVLTRLGEVGKAESLETTVGLAESGGSTAALMRASRLAHRGRADAAAAELADADDPASRAARARHLLACGRSGDALVVLDEGASGTSAGAADPRLALRFSAAWANGSDLGDEVEAALATQRSLELLRCAISSRQRRGIPLDGLAGLIGVEAAPRSVKEADWAAAARFELGDVDGVLAVGDVGLRLGSVARYHVARALYVRRRFDEAARLARTLHGTSRHWDGDKLLSRILLEQGRWDEALESRAHSGRLSDAFDEVRYFALLHLGRTAEAFATYPHHNDVVRLDAWRSQAAAAAVGAGLGSGRTMVVTQDGPGDEVLQAAGLGSIDRPLVTCDPRLQSLLSRSLPDVEFVSCQRTGSRPPFGFTGPGSTRSDGVLFDLLDTDAAALAAGAERVLLGRRWPTLLERGAPHAPYLQPVPATVATLRRRVGDGAVGVVWRSEFNDPMRSIHYLTAAQLAPLAAALGDRPLVCLQHDVTAEERAQLASLDFTRIVFLDDLDLRDDFETLAATVAACDAVIGVGTTTTELAAAVGTDTVALHPNLIGAWRAVDGGPGQLPRDVWHQTMRLAVTEDVAAPGTAVDQAARWLRERP